MTRRCRPHQLHRSVCLSVRGPSVRALVSRLAAIKYYYCCDLSSRRFFHRRCSFLDRPFRNGPLKCTRRRYRTARFVFGFDIILIFRAYVCIFPIALFFSVLKIVLSCTVLAWQRTMTRSRRRVWW